MSGSCQTCCPVRPSRAVAARRVRPFPASIPARARARTAVGTLASQALELPAGVLPACARALACFLERLLELHPGSALHDGLAWEVCPHRSRGEDQNGDARD